MSYTKITTSFKDHETVLTAAHLQHMENGITDNDAALVNRVRTDVNNQGLSVAQKSNARMNIDAPSTAEMTAAVAAEADLRSAADAAMETKTDGIQDEVDQAKEDITDLQAVSSSMVKTKMVTGNPITIKDALAGKAKKLVINLEPKQSLNGYSKPWVGGTGKNLLKPFSNSPYTLNGITATLLSDGTYLMTGTATDTAELVFPAVDRDSSKSYCISGSPAGGSTTTYRLIVRLYNGSSLLGTLTDSGSGLLVAPSEQPTANKMMVGIWFASGQNASNKIFKPMVVEGTSASAFEPYSNICPITGWDEVRIAVCDHNIFNKSGVVLGKNWIDQPANGRAILYFSIEQGATYHYYCRKLNNKNLGFVYGENATVGGNQTFSMNSGMSSLTDGIFEHVATNTLGFIQFQWNDITNETPFTQEDLDSWEIIISKSNIATYSISLSSAGTVYGGTLDATTGELMVDRAIFVCSSQDALTYSATTKTFYHSASTLKVPAPTGSSMQLAFQGISDRFVPAPSGMNEAAWSKATECYVGYTNPYQLRFKIPSAGTDEEAARAILDGTEVVYTINNPVTYHLTPAEVSTLLGTNTVSANAGQLALEYKVDKYGDADRLLSSYPVRSAGPADMLSIDDGAAVVPVKGLSIVIDPKQDLNGYTKPWIGGSGKNLYTLKIGQDLFANNANATHTSTTEEMTIDMSDDISSGVYASSNSTVRQLLTTLNGAYTISLDIKANEARDDILFGLQGVKTSKIAVSTSWTRVSVSATLSGTNPALVIYNNHGGTGTGCTLTVRNLMVEAGSTASAYEPYENICPISGFTSAKVTQRGKNLLPPNDIVIWQNGSINTSGNNFASDYGIRMADFSPISPDTEYTFSAFGQSDDCALFCYDADYNLLYRFQLWSINNGNGRYATFTTPNNTAYYKVRLTGSNYRPDRTMNMQLEFGSTATAYEPYQETSYDISLEKAGTVYGGTLNVLTGELTVDRGSTTLADKTFSERQGSILPAGGYYVINGFSDWISASKAIVSDMLQGTVFADRGAEGTISPLNSTSAAVNSLALFTKKAKDEAVAAYKDATICYPLANPLTYQLTPQEVSTLLGCNTFSCDAGRITLSYRADPSLLINKLLTAITAYGITV